MTTTLMNGLTEVVTNTPDARPRYDTVEGQLELRPIEYVGTRDVIFHPDLMQIETPYPYTVEGIVCVAIKRENGRLDFYEVPSG